MFSGTQQQMFGQYNRWMNEKLYAAAARLSDEQRKADLGAFFKSIHATFEHLLRADTLWLQRFRGAPVTAPTPTINGFSHSDFDALTAARVACDQDIMRWVDTLTSDWLAKPYAWSTLSGRAFVHPGFAVVAHFFNHQTHHRGQITTLLTQLGVDAGVTDVLLLPELDGSAG